MTDKSVIYTLCNSLFRRKDFLCAWSVRESKCNWKI